MAKINKIICDICDKEIDVDSGLSMYESIKPDKSFTFNPQVKPELIKVSFDICIDCSVKVENFIEDSKKI